MLNCYIINSIILYKILYVFCEVCQENSLFFPALNYEREKEGGASLAGAPAGHKNQYIPGQKAEERPETRRRILSDGGGAIFRYLF